MTELKLWCYVKGDTNYFRVSISSSQVIYGLKKQIHDEKPNTFARCDASDLELTRTDVAFELVEGDIYNGQYWPNASDRQLRSRDQISAIWPEQPSYDNLHIFITPPPGGETPAPDARKRMPESHSGDDGRCKRQKISPEVAGVSESDQRMLAEIYESIEKLSDNPADYADPSQAILLPFPSENVVPPRFDLSGDGLFSYIGREKFTIIWETWLKIKADTRHRQAIYVYGTRGYGKSHILAALACLLVRKKEPVVYLPDCREMLREPLGYLRNALLFAFADSSSSDYRECIYECEDIEALADFCMKYKRGGLCFIIDQLNAFDPELMGEDNVTDQEKQDLSRLLQRISAGHVLITSASANHQSALHMASKDTGDQKIPLLGGMTTVEMSSWWSLFALEFAAFSQTEKQRIEDLTGCIPLFLTPFLKHDKHNKSLESLEPGIWDEDVLASVQTTAFNFGVGKIQDPLFHDVYVPTMRACLTRSYTSGYFHMLDHHYFYVENDYGRYTCGLAREGIVKFLRIHAQEGFFLGSEWYQALKVFKNNPSVIGFTVEQMVISRIASRGLRWGDNEIPPTKITTFHGNIIAFSKDMPSAYYVPLNFNLKVVDAIYVEVNEPQNTVTIVAIQITVAKRHRDSPAEFFAQWEQWTNSLRGFTITPIFLWIVEGTQGQADVEEKLREMRTGQKTLWPKHVTHWVSIDQVDTELAKTLERIRG